MTFAKINVPTFEITIPSTNKNIVCRPYLTGENRILLSALESSSTVEITNSIKQVINNCVLDWKGHSLEKLAIFDLEFIFLKLRSKAKGQIIKVQFNGIDDDSVECDECKQPKIIEIDLNNLEVYKDPSHTKKIKLTDNITVEMDYPKYEFIGELTLKDLDKVSEHELLFNMIRSCIVNVFVDDEVFEAKDATEEEITEFLDSLNDEQSAKLVDFFITMPRIQYTVDLSCKKCGRKDVQTITGLQRFFE